MSLKRCSLAIALLLSFTCAAFGQTEEPPHTSMIMNVVVSLLPIVLIAVFIWFFFVRSLRKLQTSAVDEQRQYRQNVEKLLERIATALEEKGKP